MSAPPLAADGPRFAGRIPVSQIGDIHVIAPMVCAMVAAAPFFVGAVWCLDDKATGWHAVVMFALLLVFVLLALAAMAAGSVGWTMIEDRWQRRRGRPKDFNRTTRVEIGPHGLSVDGLGHSIWRDVLATEGVPDSDSYLIVHTRLFGKLLLEASLDELMPVFAHHLARPQALESDTLALRAIVFHWPRFCAWIWSGYVLAGAVAVGMVLGNPHIGFFGLLAAFGLLAPLIAWLVWSIPFAQLDTFSAERVRAFELDGTVLRSTDGRLRIDLQQRPANYRHERGIGYEIEFLTLRPNEGGRLDLVLGTDPSHQALIGALAALGLLTGREQRPVSN